jgi:hypothetical protein
MSAHLITTVAQETDCPRCGAAILAAVAEGLHARVDPTPLTPDGEILALAVGRWTYTHTSVGELVRRDYGRITANPHLRGPTLPDHRCGQLLAPIPPPPATAHAADIPPF